MLKVMNSKCDQCLFTKNRVVSSVRMAEIVDECLAHDTYFECHKGTIVHDHIVCRGFYDLYKYDVLVTRIACMYNFIDFVEVGKF